MFANLRKIPTTELNQYARRLHQKSGIFDDVGFPCGSTLRGGVSSRTILSNTRNTNETPATLECGDMLWGGESAVCLNCYSEYKHQKYGDVESIPLRGSSEEKEAEEALDANESGLTHFVKKHPFLTATFGVLFTLGAVGAAVGGYRAYSLPSALASTRKQPETITNATTQIATIQSTTTEVANLTTTATPSQPTTAEVANLTTTVTLAPTQPTTAEVANLTTAATLAQTQQITTEVASLTTALTATTASSTAVPVLNLTTTAEPVNAALATTGLTSPKYAGVKQISLLIDNMRDYELEAKFTLCSKAGCTVKNALLSEISNRTITLNLPEDFRTAEVDYDFIGRRGRDLEDALGVDHFARGKVSFPNSSVIDSYDKNSDGKLEVRHTLMNFKKADRIARDYEDTNGMPVYPSVTTKRMKVVLDNRWALHTRFALSGKRPASSVDFNQVSVWAYNEKEFPIGVNKLVVGVDSYPKKSFSGAKLNELMAKSKSSQTVCITANYDQPSYLSDLHQGRCGR